MWIAYNGLSPFFEKTQIFYKKTAYRFSITSTKWCSLGYKKNNHFFPCPKFWLARSRIQQSRLVLRFWFYVYDTVHSNDDDGHIMMNALVWCLNCLFLSLLLFLLRCDDASRSRANKRTIHSQAEAEAYHSKQCSGTSHRREGKNYTSYRIRTATAHTNPPRSIICVRSKRERTHIHIVVVLDTATRVCVAIETYHVNAMNFVYLH